MGVSSVVMHRLCLLSCGLVLWPACRFVRVRVVRASRGFTCRCCGLCIVMAHFVMAFTVVAYIVITSIAMAYVVLANGVMHVGVSTCAHAHAHAAHLAYVSVPSPMNDGPAGGL